MTSHWENDGPHPEDEPRGLPRVPYARTYVLLPPGTNEDWARAAVEATWDRQRFTVGGSADDAGIGDLDFRRVLAVNPAAWGDDLAGFFEQYYPGVLYVPVEAPTPDALKALLETLQPPCVPPPQPDPPRGLPRVPYARTYVLLPPEANGDWALTAMSACWEMQRFTVGGSADDAGIGDLDFRRVLAVNPAAWGDDLAGFFEQYYPGVTYEPVVTSNTYQLHGRLRALCLRDSGVSFAYPTTRMPPLVTDEFGVDRVTYYHNGLDLLCSWDRWEDDVLSATEGEVLVAGWNPAEPWYGFQVRVRHVLPGGQEALLRYAHFKSDEEGGVYVQRFQHVQRGQPLGRPNCTGVTHSGEPTCTGDHLHLDVKVEGEYVDPALLIEWPE
jgi:hypothetical protein